jgi:hypothetical protein
VRLLFQKNKTERLNLVNDRNSSAALSSQMTLQRRGGQTREVDYQRRMLRQYEIEIESA